MAPDDLHSFEIPKPPRAPFNSRYAGVRWVPVAAVADTVLVGDTSWSGWPR
jgi:hypothetical protein